MTTMIGYYHHKKGERSYLTQHEEILLPLMVIPETFTTFLPTHFGEGPKIKTFYKIIEKRREF